MCTYRGTADLIRIAKDVQDGDGPDWYDEPFEHGQRGQLRGWHWKELFIEVYLEAETAKPDSAMSTRYTSLR